MDGPRSTELTETNPLFYNLSTWLTIIIEYMNTSWGCYNLYFICYPKIQRHTGDFVLQISFGIGRD